MYQPDIAQNLGSVLRLCACFGMEMHVVEPCGFPLDDRRLKRAGMDYIDQVAMHKHSSWQAFEAHRAEHKGRILALTTKASEPYHRMEYATNDYLLLGQESSGLPESIHQVVDGRIIIPMQPEARSFNVAMSAAIVAAEAMRQIEWN